MALALTDRLKFACKGFEGAGEKAAVDLLVAASALDTRVGFGHFLSKAEGLGSFKNRGSEACSVMCAGWARGKGEGEKWGVGHRTHLQGNGRVCGGRSFPGCGGCPSALPPPPSGGPG